MDYEKMFNDAVELFNSRKYDEAAEKFENVAIATNNVAAIANAIRAYHMEAILDYTVTRNGLFDEVYSLKAVTKALDLLQFTIDNRILGDDEFRNILKDCYSIKGYILLRCENDDCEIYLNKAIDMGHNQSRAWMMYRYVKAVKKECNDDMINLYIERMESLGELYVQNYSPEDTEDDDLRLVSELLSGLFEEKNPEKSRQYAQIANSYNEITRTSNFSQKNKNNSYQYQSTGQQPAHGKAVASLVLGIAGLICCGICGLIGLILAISAKNEGNNESIRTAGFVLGVVSCALWGIGVIYAVISGAFTAAMY